MEIEHFDVADDDSGRNIGAYNTKKAISLLQISHEKLKMRTAFIYKLIGKQRLHINYFFHITLHIFLNYFIYTNSSLYKKSDSICLFALPLSFLCVYHLKFQIKKLKRICQRTKFLNTHQYSTKLYPLKKKNLMPNNLRWEDGNGKMSSPQS